MKVTCPACSQRIALDADDIAALAGARTFACPACGGEITVTSDPRPDSSGDSGRRGGWVAPDAGELDQSFDSRYEIKRLIGRGGMGAVYEGWDTRLDRRVAIKVLPTETGSNSQALLRFEREAKAMAALDHPNIVQIHDYGQTAEGHPYFVMDYIDGMDVHHLRNTGQLDLPGALDLVSQVCAALQYAHSRGIIHRDIKPANIMVNREGVAKVADFGLAKVMDTDTHSHHEPTLTKSGTALGTPEYMAPEQLEGTPVDHRADIYSLGVMLYDLLTGSPPRGAWPPPSQRVQIDVRLDEIVLRALQHSPSARYQAAAEVRADIESIKTSTGGGPVPPGVDPGPLPSSGIAPLPRHAAPAASVRPSAPAQHPQNAQTSAPAPSGDGLGTTMLILGVLAILILGGLAFYLASQKDKPTQTNREVVENTTIHRDIPPGMTAQDLEGVRDIFSHDRGFIGISMEALDWDQAVTLAKRTGAEVISVDEADPEWSSLHKWLRDKFAAPLKMKTWVKSQGKPHLLNGEKIAISEPASSSAGQPRHKALLYWAAGTAARATPHSGSTALGTNESLGNWTLVGWNEATVGPEPPYVLTQDGVLMTSKQKNGWYLMTSRVFPAMTFSVEFRHPVSASGHGGQVVVGSPGPRDLTSSDYTQRIPLGFEFKLGSGVCGQLELPRADYPAELPLGQTRSGRRVNRSRPIDPVAGEWNRLEVECTADRSVVAKLNGEVINSVTKVENVDGRIILWPIDEIHFRNPTVTVNGKTEKLDFTLTRLAAKLPGDAFPAEESSSATADWIDLFYGKDVSGWKGSKDPGFPDGAWGIEDGALRNFHGTNHQDLETRETFRDFELELEWKTSPGGNSGIFYGTREFQLVDDDGSSNGKIPVTSCGALCYFIAPNNNKRLKPAGEFNHGKLVVRGNQVEHWINGAKIVEYQLNSAHFQSLVDAGEFKNLPGYRKIDTTAGETRIGLQSHGGNVWFRNIRIRKLDGSQASNDIPIKQEIDLLALTDPVKDRVMPGSFGGANVWEKTNGVLRYKSDGKSGKIVPPVAIHATSYEVEFYKRRLDGDGWFNCSLPIAGQILPISLSNRLPIHGKDGEPMPLPLPSEGRYAIRHDVGSNGQPDRITIRFNGATVSKWKGNVTPYLKDLKGLEEHPEFPRQPLLSMFCGKDNFEFTEWKLRVFEGEAKILREAVGLTSQQAPSTSPLSVTNANVDSVIATCRDQLMSDNEQTCIAGLQRLGSLGGAAIAEAALVERLIEHSSWNIQFAAVRALPEIIGPEAAARKFDSIVRDASKRRARVPALVGLETCGSLGLPTVGWALKSAEEDLVYQSLITACIIDEEGIYRPEIDQMLARNPSEKIAKQVRKYILHDCIRRFFDEYSRWPKDFIEADAFVRKTNPLLALGQLADPVQTWFEPQPDGVLKVRYNTPLPGGGFQTGTYHLIKQPRKSSPSPQAVLPWTNTNGVTIQAEFVRIESESVVIRKDGKEFTLRLAQLSPASRQQALDLAKGTDPASE